MIRLQLGNAFDVTAERRQTDYRRLNEGKDEPERSESAWAITVKNAREEAVTVRVRETLPGDWQILEESAAHTKASADAAVWQVLVPAKGSAQLTYRVRVRH